MPKRRDAPLFFLDERLPPNVGRALALVGYPITVPDNEGKRGAADEDLIPWMAERGLVWITKDDAARRQHAPALTRFRLSVVWVRGLERTKKHITDRELHLMLTLKLPAIQAAVQRARGPVWFLLYLSGERPTLQTLTPNVPLPGEGRRRS